MNIDRVCKIIKLFICILVTVAVACVIAELYSINIKPKLLENEYGIEIIEKKVGQFASVYYAVDENTQGKCYLFDFKDESREPELVYEFEGITDVEAKRIAKINGYDVEYIFLKYTPAYNEKDITNHLTWMIYYNRSRLEYLKIDFLNGEILDIRSDNGNR